MVLVCYIFLVINLTKLNFGCKLIQGFFKVMFPGLFSLWSLYFYVFFFF